MRAIWKGTISFGLVSIPVSVYPATREEKVSFKQLRRKDLSPIKYKKVAEADEKEVPSDEIIKGYEYEKGKWVTLEEADFEKVEIASTQVIEITDFVELSDINPKFFYKPYFLEAQKGGEKGYSLLHRALFDTGKVGIAKVAIRSREYLASVKPDGLFLILDLMHFAQEVLETDELKVSAGADHGEQELKMARLLVDSMSRDWDPTLYHDQYQVALQEVIDSKIEQKPVKTKAPRPAVAKETVDILAILQKSLESAGGAKRNDGRGTKPAAAPRTTRALVTQKRRVKA